MSVTATGVPRKAAVPHEHASGPGLWPPRTADHSTFVGRSPGESAADRAGEKTRALAGRLVEELAVALVAASARERSEHERRERAVPPALAAAREELPGGVAR